MTAAKALISQGLTTYKPLSISMGIRNTCLGKRKRFLNYDWKYQ